MTPPSSMEPTLNYDTDSRLIFFRLDKAEDSIRHFGKVEAVLNDRQTKLKKDVDEAHAKLRSLQAVHESATVDKFKAWAASAVAAFLGVVIIELMKFILAHVR